MPILRPRSGAPPGQAGNHRHTLSGWRAAALVAFLAGATYVGSLWNGFAYDDIALLETHSTVQGGSLSEALTAPYWLIEGDWGTLYRPVTLASLTLEWGLFEGEPTAFHLVNVALHVGVSLLVLLLAFRLTDRSSDPGRIGGLVAAALYAVHPVHVEAVANVAGRPELFAASAFLGGALLYLWRAKSPVARGARVAGIAALYALGLGSKEVAVTLPAVLILLEAFRPTFQKETTSLSRQLDVVPSSLMGRCAREGPVWVAMGTVLLAYLVLRVHATGSLVGEELPAELFGSTGGERFLTALSLWPHYARLMLFPADLSVEYGPPLLGLVSGLSPQVLAGALVLAGTIALAARLRYTMPAVSLGLTWFLITVLPVAHLGVHAGVLLAERTLYLPSVGVALALGAAAGHWASRRQNRRWSEAAAALALVLLMARSVTRVPTWESTYSVMNTLAMEHPESHRAHRARAEGFRQVGEMERAAESYRMAVALLPHRYDLLTEVGAFMRDISSLDEARGLLGHATEVAPQRATAWRLLAEVNLLQRRGREAHRAALEGLRAGGDRSVLLGFLSESYVLRNDLGAAVRARRAALAADPQSSHHRARLEELVRARAAMSDAS